MPHLRVETTAEPTTRTVRTFAEWATERYAETMETGTGHVAVSVDRSDEGTLSLGRAAEGEPIALCDFDVRAGRSGEQRESFAAGVIGRLERDFGVPRANSYVVYTEHSGADFHLAEGPLGSWSDAESDQGALD